MTKAADLETEKIKQNKEKPEAKRKHKFKAAKWTHPNGHPRCIVCGDEERIGGFCEPMEKSEVDLLKGSLQRRNPFNPRKHTSEEEISDIKGWVGYSPDDKKRQLLDPMNENAKIRALNKLTRHTKTRRNKEGEVEYLLHRGMGQDEHEKFRSGDSFFNNEKKSSWTPHFDIADSMALDQQAWYDDPSNKASFGKKAAVVSAWVPKKDIHHIPKQVTGEDVGSEHEVILNHSRPYEIYNNHKDKTKEQIVDKKINLKAGKTGDKASYKARSLKQIKPRETHQGQFGWMGEEKKLAASEQTTSDLHKSDFVRRGILLAALSGGAQHMYNEEHQQKEPISRQVANVDMDKPKTEPELAYNQAQKDAFTIAAKHMPLSRNLARKTIKESPDLSRSHGYLLHLSPIAFKEVIDNNSEIKRDIASYHYPKLYEQHQGDQDKIFDDYKKRATNAKTNTYEK